MKENRAATSRENHVYFGSCFSSIYLWCAPNRRSTTAPWRAKFAVRRVGLAAANTYLPGVFHCGSVP
jgi:hypothetical protein